MHSVNHRPTCICARKNFDQVRISFCLFWYDYTDTCIYSPCRCNIHVIYTVIKFGNFFCVYTVLLSESKSTANWLICSYQWAAWMGLCLRVWRGHHDGLHEYNISNEHDRCVRRRQLPVKKTLFSFEWCRCCWLWSSWYCCLTCKDCWTSNVYVCSKYTYVSLFGFYSEHVVHSTLTQAE